jgi:tRNA modification GTPase
VRETSDAIEREAIALSGAEVKRADLIVLVLDASEPITAEERQLMNLYSEAIVVWNKWDVAADGVERATDSGLRTVATTGEGVDRLHVEIRRRFGCETFDETRPRCWTERPRERFGHPDHRNRAMS